MDTVTITSPPSGGSIEAVTSKSAAHRLLIAGFMSGLDVEHCCEDCSDDIAATKECLAELGRYRADSECKGCRLDCRESGSTLRFLMPLAGALGIECDFVCKGRLADRPMEPFLASLAEHGCTVTGRDLKHLRGQLTAGVFHLPGSVSSQFITGLLMALPVLAGDSRIVVNERIQSRPYVDLTLQVLGMAGIEIQESTVEDGSVFVVPGGQKYALPERKLYDIEGDWSNAAFWIVMSAMRGKHITINGLNSSSVQGDKEIVSIADTILSSNATKTEVTIDAADTPDLVPAVAVLACARPAGSITRIVNAGRLRYKESDRLNAAAEVLSKLGAEVSQTEDSLAVKSNGKLTGGTVDAHGDHRIVMMAAAAACISEGPVTITGAKAVNKSYPDFFEDYQKLGGKLQWL